MTVISSTEFASHQDMYFEMAIDEQVFIQKNENMFLLTCKNINEVTTYHEASVYDEVSEPDEDFNRALSAEEFRKRLIEVLHKVDNKYAKNTSNTFT